MLFALFAIDLHNVVIAIPAMILVLGVMIIVHEFGHYAVAKMLGVRVEVFSIGFGKRLIGFKRGDTDYRIAAIPLGGYVKMSGENPMDERTGDKAEFMSHPRWHRFLIAIAGPFMNIILAVVLLTGVFMVRYQYPAFLNEPVVIGYVEDGSPAQKAGLQNGDEIVKVGSKQNPTWETMKFEIALSPKDPLPLTVKRGTEVFNTSVTPNAVGRDQIGEIGIDPSRPVKVASVDPGKAAEKAGIKPGDVIESIDGIRLYSLEQLTSYLAKHGTTPVTLAVQRGGNTFQSQVTPVEENIEGRKMNRIGFTFQEPVHVAKLSFTKALGVSISENKKYSGLILELVQKMLRGRVSPRQVSGPIEIARMSGQAIAEPGWIPLASLMAAISLNLGIFNLFPIPILDGGVILLLLIEGFIRRDISLAVKERIYQVAFVFLVLFAAMVIYNDIAKNFVGLAQH